VSCCLNNKHRRRQIVDGIALITEDVAQTEEVLSSAETETKRTGLFANGKKTEVMLINGGVASSGS